MRAPYPPLVSREGAIRVGFQPERVWVCPLDRSACDWCIQYGDFEVDPNMDDFRGNMSEEKEASSSRQKAREHKEQLHRLQQKDPEFYQFLKEHDKDLLEFNDDDDDEYDQDDIDEEDAKTGNEYAELHVTQEKVQKMPGRVITTALVDSWCTGIKENLGIGPIRSILRAFRTACHHGDDDKHEPSQMFSIVSSTVFNKIMLFVLNEMDGILRKLLNMPSSGGKKETVVELTTTKEWKRYGSLMRLYLGNALHLLNQMTDDQMISFALKRIRASAVFLTAFPSLLRKYIKVALHFWGTGGGALPIVSFLFLRDLCIRLGSDCLETCLKGVYKAHVSNSQFVTGSKLQHIQFLGNCITELYGVDPPSAYPHAFLFIRQLAMVLREALSVKTKESFRKVYEWKFINCLELWTRVICTYSSEAEFRPLAYPLAQVINGVARLVPTARYFPLRLRCARMLNRLAESTGSFIPVSILLLDMLGMKELHRPPTGGIGKGINLFTTLKVAKVTLKTRAFQEECIYSVVEQLAEHLSQWSYSIAFFELAVIPVVQLKNFCKATKVERFRREMRELIQQVKANSEFINARRLSVRFPPNDPKAASFLEVEKESRSSPLSQYVATLRLRAQQRSNSIVESSVLVGEDSSIFGSNTSKNTEENEEMDAEEGAVVFSSSWLPGKNSRSGGKKSKHSNKNQPPEQDEDVVEELVLSSDEDDEDVHSSGTEEGSSEAEYDLPKRVDAQAALIEEIENLLDVAETLVVEKELRVTRSLLELPVWGSLRDLVAALANGGEEDDSN
ncbi:hypothetical protein QJS10_CPB11g01865 [Acorus calamus]|uniref:Nucleolar complex protein 2 homolog n=1 Tax=Acorus calamus TaxID=4465 RepID=A0AAV9DW78_ACOCL|nr:hypothetical protein QJS10_CPB11g01865 [Acorus calamus]